ncbi:MAG: hypothetical protein QXW71_05950 [Thermoplasmata archaeon]
MSSEIFIKAKKLIDEVKQIQSILYQLVFIMTSENPRSKEAKEIVDELVKMGLVSEAEVRKAINDTERWREKILDRTI